MPGEVLEIRCVRPRAHLELFGPGAPHFDAQHTTSLPVAEVVGQIEDAHRCGVRCVLLTIDAIGGQPEATFVLYDALRAFSEAGGSTLAYVTGYAASAWDVVILGADVVVIDPRAQILVHGEVRASTGEGTPTDPLAPVREAFTWTLMAARTLTPPAELSRWLQLRPNNIGAPEFARLHARDALRLGWADFVADEALARTLAEALASGARIPSPRRQALEARGVEWRHPLAAVRAYAASLRARMVNGWIPLPQPQPTKETTWQ